MTTQKVRLGGYALIAALVIAGAVIVIAALQRDERPPVSRPAEGEAPAPRPDGAPPSVEALQGIWLEDQETGGARPLMARFGADGTFFLGGVLDTDSWIHGTYEVDGQAIRFTATGGSCGSRDVFTWSGGIVSEGRLELEHRGTEEGSGVGVCTFPIGEPFHFLRVSPTSPAAADVDPGFYVGPSGPITAETGPFDLEGYWLVEGTGHLLRVDFSGGYRMDDAGALADTPSDAGSLEVGSRTLTFTSGGAANGCAEGDLMVVTNARVKEGAIRGVVSRDDCGRGLEGAVTLLFLEVRTA
jgi:hypothetical protein